jgi:hypothetical protein
MGCRSQRLAFPPLSTRRRGASEFRFEMNIVIQSVESRQFLATAPEEWVKDPHDGLIFCDMRHALAYCRRHELANVRLVVFFRNKRVSLLLYVPGSAAPAPAGTTKSTSKREPVLG